MRIHRSLRRRSPDAGKSRLIRALPSYRTVLILALFCSCLVVRQSPGNGEFLANSTKPRRSIRSSAQVPESEIQNSIIPRTLIFTHRYDLLTVNVDELDIKEQDERTELKALQDNVQQIIQLHHSPTVRFLTDNECQQSIRNVLNVTAATELLQYFDAEPAGMFKADLCRGAALYQTGGLYFDVDLGVRTNIFAVLDATTEFVTVQVHPLSKYANFFFQAFMGATPHHPVVFRYVELFLEYYRGNIPEIVPGDPVGVILLKMAYEQLREDDSISHVTELWKEVLYQPVFRYTTFRHVPFPDWGTARSCKFIVTKGSSMVPFYSRIPGSRMCLEEDPMEYGNILSQVGDYVAKRVAQYRHPKKKRPVPVVVVTPT